MDKDKASYLLRGTSCVGEPGSNALAALQAGDLTYFVDTLNREDYQDAEAGKFPKSENHWINERLKEYEGHTLLTKAISDNLPAFVQYLINGGADVNLYNNEMSKYPIHVAATVGNVDIMRALVQCETNGSAVPIKFRSNGAGPLGKTLASNKADVNATTRFGKTALHIAVEQNHTKLVEFLLKQTNVQVDVKDKKGGQTPLYLAVKKENLTLIRLLIENGAKQDTIVKGQPISNLLAELAANKPEFRLLNNVQILRAPLVRETSGSTVDRLINLADTATLRKPTERDIKEFNNLLLELGESKTNITDVGGSSLLQKSCFAGASDYVDSLLGEGVDPNHMPGQSINPPVVIAAERGYVEVLKVLCKYKADFTVHKKGTLDTALHRVLIRDPTATSDTNLLECLDYLLSCEDEPVKSGISSIINKKDCHDNTALHFATQKWDQTVVRKLLDRGANIGIKNRWGDIPVEKIEPGTLESFLDEHCLQHTNDMNHDDFKLKFKYDFLAPPVENLPESAKGPYQAFDEEDQRLSSCGRKEERIALPETESLWYMTLTKDHRHLLKHPVITSFLWLKWARIRRYFNRNLRFFALFVMVHTWYVFEQFGGQSIRGQDGSVQGWPQVFIFFSAAMLIMVLMDWVLDIQDFEERLRVLEDSGRPEPSRCKHAAKLFLRNWLEIAYIGGLVVVNIFGASCLWLVLLLLIIGLTARELFQMAVSLRRYFLDPENLVEVIMITLTFIILLRPDSPEPELTDKDPENDEYKAFLFELELKRHFASISLLLAWIELITFIARHPRLNSYNVYVRMFYKVMSTFFFFLLLSINVLVAAGLGFYIMLHNDFKHSLQKDDDYEFFNSPWLALVKVSTMFVGELEFSDIPVNLDSNLASLSYIFFLVFVFIVVVVLMNLLNGLAVSDTGTMHEQSEIVSYLSQVETISYAESILLGDPFNFLSQWPRIDWLLQGRDTSLSCFRQVYKNRSARSLFQKLTGATNLLLFYNYLKDKEWTIKPNSDAETCSLKISLPKSILDSARRVILKKEKALKEQSIEAKIESVEKKLDLILERLQINH